MTLLGNIVATIMFNAQMSFFARISDGDIGGTYMTLLNTIANLGSKWPQTLTLYALDPLTTRACAIQRPLDHIPPALLHKPDAAGGAYAASAVLAMPACASNVSTTEPPFQSQLCLDAGGEKNPQTAPAPCFPEPVWGARVWGDGGGKVSCGQ